MEKSREGRALHIANSWTLPFYLLPFYLLREDGGPGRGELTLRLLGGGERFLNEGVFRRFGFDNVRTSQLQTASQEQGNGKCPCKVYAICAIAGR